MKPRIEKKLSKKIHAILGNLLGEVWIDNELELHPPHYRWHRCKDCPRLTGKQERENRQMRVSVNHMPSIGGGLDYWGERQDGNSVLCVAKEDLPWFFAKKTDHAGPHGGYPQLKARVTGDWVIKHAKLYAMQEQAKAAKKALDKAFVEQLKADGAIRWKAGDGWVAKCVMCKELTPLYCDPVDFDRHYHYCGGSPRCCP
ncbi:hypothetical protein WH06_01950 [Aeromonas salmonicida subsp. salmonicida]|uniref:Uncharacterized protein n=2 Tax=Aeromonas salmonicida subsp. salmonicida TaxID=29491 RepID=A0A0A7KVV8_AERSS|nr:hypothetical protein [Aeromonas salmonicida]AIZ49551.1 hypothetical protein [Aeromonas salmonicida subsp. salmonicida]AYO63737.1 hypothetical protein C5P03_13660 [Aeromonas salmonicida subsp. salmonicida 01-B526]EHI54301.1 hypothetical protein IYQ_00927 [Aeromonas salmonicida subsp. salmonicida 01-B526]OKA83853.1 hypothetical protein BHR40_03455 [Aeromonas salmonicida subsp. salmonicida]OSM53937.1 hypothetical protein WH06_01950 [Aeromonas salmonicida subsp. salmonicida]